MRVVTSDGDSLIQRSLEALQDQRERSSFWPIHRSTTVDAHAIARITRDLGGRLSAKLLSRAEALPASVAHEPLLCWM